MDGIRQLGWRTAAAAEARIAVKPTRKSASTTAPKVGRALRRAANDARRTAGMHARVARVDRIDLSLAQAQMVARTASRTPEVMVKVLSGGAISAKSVQRHLDYIGRKGEVELHTDEGDALKDRATAAGLPDDWNLHLAEAGASKQIGKGTKARPVRRVH